MGLMDKLFGKKKDYFQGMAKTAQMLGEDLYWQVVAESLKNTCDQDSQELFLIKRLKKLTPVEIVGFRLRTDKLLYDTYNAETWCAGYIMNGGCSDDGFEYFRNWIISRGKEVYYKAKDNPDTLISEVDKDLEMYDFESFWYVGLEAFREKTGEDLYEYIDEENFKFKEGHYPAIQFNWQEDNAASMRAICPALFDRLWK
ncbi:MAG: DUF4240 domain-containing protein [Chitinophagaceae bacterium]|nr:MAG: DUF4240 domain-containing protein [Chitinophagaceae bacterium]